MDQAIEDLDETVHSQNTAHSYHGSCTVCAKAKSKCVRRPGNGDCDRCTRLQKTCQIREPVKRKRKARKITRSAQLQHLETKLADIAQALASKQTQEVSAGLDFRSDISQQTNGLHRESDNMYPTPLVTTPNTTRSNDFLASAHGPTLEMVNTEHVLTEMDATDADVLLDRYQRLMAPHMPFVIIPRGINASDLARSKPFLLKAIETVTFFHDTTTQQFMVKDLMQQISERMLINGEKSLDLLQGMLVFSNWYNPHLFAPPSHNVLLHLTMALTHDLDIDRAPGFCEKVTLMAASQAHGVPQPAKVVTNDERRAVLGTFYLTSQIFTSFRKIDTLHWSPWLTKCADALTQAEEYESDLLLVQLTRSQRIMQEAMGTEYDHAPVSFYAKSFLSDLDNIGLASVHGTSAIVLRLQQACARTAIWERSFGNLATHTVKETDLRQRLDGMWHCMDAAKKYTDIYLELLVEDYPLVPFGVFAQFAYIFVVLVRASLIEMDGWDVKALRSFIDFSSLLEKASQRYDAVSQSRLDGLFLRNEAFAKWSAKTKWAKSFYDTKFLPVDPNAPSNNQTPLGRTTVDANKAQELHGALPTPLEPSSSTDTFAFGDSMWASFDDPAAFLGDIDFALADVS
ncbi:hypothetical protein ACET3X_002794 [Alternaria dauci]|uniref:Zn(2)-C6 fungal-type domain-containing protein n=1 Tax=Alternaria dauci TaxID=48095 RepID=A0ABR3UQL0_9PLEO